MPGWMNPEPFGWEGIVEDALSEDIGSGDLSSASFPREHWSQWYIEAQGNGVLCGSGIVEYLLSPQFDDSRAFIEILVEDGQPVKRGTIIARGRSHTAKILMAERTSLNFLMHLSGVATLTSQFVERVAGTKAQIVDTRKTIPGLRTLQKYAVRCGGGRNHRMGLYDAVMLKDNHIRAHGSIADAVRAVRSYLSHMTKIEIECDQPEQVEEAIRSGCEVIMLDNMNPFTMREIVQKYRGEAIFEASGGINLDTVRGVADTGVQVISVGALTHSSTSVPFHMEFS
jgi:nicotinate-nucleotide pyrophosphorylase (carboxylating)